MLTKQRRRSSIAIESPKIQRARRKLSEQLQKQKELITPKALAQAIEAIYERIAANAGGRIALKNKELSLFDRNVNPAAVSRKVEEIAKMLQ